MAKAKRKSIRKSKASVSKKPAKPAKGREFNAGYLGVGIALGVALGAAMDNIGAGIAIGVALGAAFGAARRKAK